MTTKPAFVCSHGHAYTEWELECGMREVYMAAEQEMREAEHNYDQDTGREAGLARAHAFDESECPWPWYADSPVDVVAPEVFGTVFTG